MSENLTFNQISILASDLRAVSDATYPVKGIISDEYNSTAHYVVGDYCIRNNVLYRCNTNTPNNGEVWNADHWDESSVGEALSKIDWKLLWENASPASEFAAQTVSLDLSEYSEFAVLFLADGATGGSYVYGVSHVAEGYLTQLQLFVSGKNHRRFVTITSSGAVFTGGAYENTYGATSGTASNTSIIPNKILAR